MKSFTIIGDSFPARLRADLVDTEQCLNFKLSPELVSVAWACRGGLTIERLVYNYSRGIMSIPKADAYVVHIGSNDLVEMSAAEFCRKTVVKLVPLLLSCGGSHVVFGQILYRRPGHYTKSLDIVSYNAKVDRANAILEAEAGANDQFSFWKHKNITQSGHFNKMWSQDGVHLRIQEGHPHFIRSLRGATLFHGARVFGLR